MQELDDITLLREFTERNSEEAFASLVQRHINKVYSVALRHTRNPHSAEEITQAVFVILARKAKQLRKGVIVEGWLYETARLTAMTFIRSEIRRARREKEAHVQNVLNEDESEVWRQIAPELDAALAELDKSDRNAVVLRFFYGKSMSDIGAALGATEEGARKRVSRTLDKLRAYFFKRGITSTAGTIAGAISANSVQVAPVTLAKTTTAVALAKGATTSISTATLIKGALKIMAWTKTKTAIVVGAVVILTTGMTTTMVIRHRHQVEHRNQTEFPRGSWAFVGYSTPEDSIQTVSWAMREHNSSSLQAYLNGLVPEMSDKMEQEIQSRGSNAFAELCAHEMGGVTRYRILKITTLSNDRVELRIQFGGLKGPVQTMALEKIGSEWKFTPEANQAQTSVKESSYRIAEMDMMRGSVFPAVMQFAKEHQDEIPNSMADLKPYLPADASGVDDDHWQISATGKLTPLLTRGDVVLFQQKDAPPNQQRIIVYADGHVAWK